MPRRKYSLLPEHENKEINCFAFYLNRAGQPSCRALNEIYCLKDLVPCAFFATPRQAAQSAERAARRLRVQEEERRSDKCAVCTHRTCESGVGKEVDG